MENTNSESNPAQAITKKSLYFEAVKSISVGTLLAVAAGIGANIIHHSRRAGHLAFPKRNEIKTLLNNKTTFAVGAVFGFFGIRDALKNNREFERVSTKLPESFAERLAHDNNNAKPASRVDH